MLTFYVVRHGNTKFTTGRNKLQGWLDSPLNKEGRTDAKALGKLLKGVSFDAVYSSDLKRAKQTAELIKRVIRFHKHIKTVRVLREINFGKAAGLDISEVRRQYPLYKKKASFVFPRGESYEGMQQRVMRFVLSLEKKHNRKTLLLATHAGCIRGLLCALKKTSFDKKNLRISISHRLIAKFVINKGKLL